MRQLALLFGVIGLVLAGLIWTSNSPSETVNAGTGGTDTPTATETGTTTTTLTATITATATTTSTPTITLTLDPCAQLLKAPKLVSPSNNYKTTHQQLTLDWKKVPCKPKYTVEIFRDSTSGPLAQSKSKLKKLTFTTKTLTKGHSYFWRVSSCNVAGCSSSAFRKFTIVIPPTPVPTKTPAPPTNTPPTAATTPSGNCSPSYPDFCIPPPPPDLDCGDPPVAGHHNFTVLSPDPHHFDADHDGLGCES